MSDLTDEFRALHDELAAELGQGFRLVFSWEVGGVFDAETSQWTGRTVRTATIETTPLRTATVDERDGNTVKATTRVGKVPAGKLDDAGEEFVPDLHMKVTASTQSKSLDIVKVTQHDIGDGIHKYQVYLEA